MDDVNDGKNDRESLDKWSDEWIQLKSEFGDAVADALALSAATAPPPHLKDRILRSIASDSECPARPASLPPGGRKVLPGVSAVRAGVHVSRASARRHGGGLHRLRHRRPERGHAARGGEGGLAIIVSSDADEFVNAEA